MRRAEIIEAVQNVSTALSESKVMSALARMDTTELVFAHADWVARRQSFGPAEIHILRALELSQLDEPRFWATALSEGANADPDVLGPISLMHKSARFAQSELPRLLESLLAVETDPVAGKGTVVQADGQAPGQLKVLVIENEAFSTPERLVLVLTAIDNLYNGCAQILSEPADQVSVVSCDSGGDKSFDFLGNPVVMDSVKNVVLSFWDRMVFFRDDRNEQRLRLIAESLPILEELQRLKESGVMDADTADRVRREVSDSVFMFAQAGATIPEFQNYAVYDPRELMRPEPKSEVSAEKPTAKMSTEPAPSSAPEAKTMDSVELRRIVAEKVDKVLHSQGEGDSEGDGSKEAQVAVGEEARAE